MNQLIIATENSGKLKEIRALLAELQMEIKGLVDLEQSFDIVEDAETFEGNALIKAKAVVTAIGKPALADDSGLEVDAMDGRPGVRSARYGGPGLSDGERAQKLLDELEQLKSTDRTARFRCALIYLEPTGEPQLFEGTVDGKIAHQSAGSNGFGYDPIFIPDGYNCTAAELDDAEKNRISHRGKALRAFAEWFAGRR